MLPFRVSGSCRQKVFQLTFFCKTFKRFCAFHWKGEKDRGSLRALIVPSLWLLHKCEISSPLLLIFCNMLLQQTLKRSSVVSFDVGNLGDSSKNFDATIFTCFIFKTCLVKRMTSFGPWRMHLLRRRHPTQSLLLSSELYSKWKHILMTIFEDYPWGLRLKVVIIAFWEVVIMFFFSIVVHDKGVRTSMK